LHYRPAAANAAVVDSSEVEVTPGWRFFPRHLALAFGTWEIGVRIVSPFHQSSFQFEPRRLVWTDCTLLGTCLSNLSDLNDIATARSSHKTVNE
jgi:hypothetical protein